MDDHAPIATPSVYHSARDSSISGSPDSFRTPFSTWPSDNNQGNTTPRATTAPASSSALQSLLDTERTPTRSPSTSPLLERYIQSFVPRTELTAPVSADSMPVSTRLRERKRASQSSSALSSPTRTMSSSTIQADVPQPTSTRSGSPLIKTNMLRDVSPHSVTYASQLEKAIDDVVRSLMQRGRVREGHGMRELYTQSFKDPGSADLLDVLLRRKANERQMWDFERYVEDVNRLTSQPPIVVIPGRTVSMPVRDVGTADVAGTDRPLEGVQVDGDGDGEEDTPRATRVNTYTPPSPRVVIEMPILAVSHDSENTGDAPDNQTTFPSGQPPHKQTTTGLSTLPQRLRDIPEEDDSRFAANETNNSETAEADAMVLSTQVAEHPSNMTNGTMVLSSGLSSTDHLHARRRKKTRNKMFLGANGPVYSVNALYVPLSKHRHLLWR